MTDKSVSLDCGKATEAFHEKGKVAFAKLRAANDG